jgi:hypothetical protein
LFLFDKFLLNNFNRPRYFWPVVLLLATVNVFSTIHCQAADSVLQQSIDVNKAANQRAASSQDKIDALSDQTQAMYLEYKQSLMQLDSLKLYNNNLEQLITSQQNEIKSYNSQLSQIDNTQRDVIPLMIKMVDTLAQFIQLDQPFLLSERQTRVAELKTLLTRSDVATSEKYRRIMEAYQVEMEYGRTIEAYRDTLNAGGVQRSVDFFRLGRVALYYQTLDGQETGVWDKSAKKWVALSSDYRLPVSKGLRIARKQAAPDLLILPVNAAEQSK